MHFAALDLSCRALADCWSVTPSCSPYQPSL
jgi:hypothetical protein